MSPKHPLSPIRMSAATFGFNMSRLFGRRVRAIYPHPYISFLYFPTPLVVSSYINSITFCSAHYLYYSRLDLHVKQNFHTADNTPTVERHIDAPPVQIVAWSYDVGPGNDTFSIVFLKLLSKSDRNSRLDLHLTQNFHTAHNVPTVEGHIDAPPVQIVAWSYDVGRSNDIFRIVCVFLNYITTLAIR